MDTEKMKNELFQDADFLQTEAREYYELADAYRSHGKEDDADFARNWAINAEMKFQQILRCMQRFGWDKEYMGIA